MVSVSMHPHTARRLGRFGCKELAGWGIPPHPKQNHVNKGVIYMSGQSIVIEGKERVAFDLMKYIISGEEAPVKGQPDARTYVINLYCQCMRAVNGSAAEFSLAGR